METSRRTVLKAGAVTGAAITTSITTAGLAGTRATAASLPLPADPFTLGVASGDPAPEGFVIWTRLALDPVAPDGLGGMPSSSYEVIWQIATDERFADVVKAGVARSGPEWAHAVHVEVHGLLPGREYFYRFRVGKWLSPAGRSLTTPAYGAAVSSMEMAFVSCSNFPAGFFTAYRRLAEDRPDLVLHLGDYQYEGAQTANPLGRPHLGPETTTLAGYRQRHGQYKSDPDLQAAHAIAPWLVVWDDHEVDNNYADDLADRAVEQPGFMDRRAAAYRAYYENMPLRRTSVPTGPDLQLFRRVHWGQLATFHMLDTRQYRSNQACNDGYKACPDAADPARSLPGMEQEAWLLDGFRESTQTWDILGQQVFFGRRDNTPDPAATVVSMDSWDGYPASRQRITQGWVDAGVRNPIVLTGDVHAHWASEITSDPDDPAGSVVGSEFVCTSITSGGNGADSPTGTHPWAAWNPNLRFWTNQRGYVRTTITPAQFRADFRCLPYVTERGAEAYTRASYVVEDGVRGMHQVTDTPLTEASGALTTPLARAQAAKRRPSDAEIVAETLRQEKGDRAVIG